MREALPTRPSVLIQPPAPPDQLATAIVKRPRSFPWPTAVVLLAFLGLDGIKSVYLHGHKRPELISPDNWNMDFRFMERPNAHRVQLDLFYDYRTNVDLYPKWQKFLRDRQPKTLIFWGQNDVFFTREGGEAYLKDLPSAEMHRLDSGHFAVEDSLDLIAGNIRRFYDEKVSSASHPVAARRAV